MRRVLVVVGSYAPAMIADMHRARQLAWELPAQGWDIEILCADESYQPRSCLDPDGAAFFAPGIPVHRVPQRFGFAFRVAGIGGIGPRALLPMWQAGRRLLRERRFDLVYISTSQTLLFPLGPALRRQFGIPYALDLHDPVVARGGKARSGIKHRAARWLAGRIEARAVTAASGLVSVSSRYLDDLRLRYGSAGPAWLAPEQHAVIPFAVMPRDVDEAASQMPPPPRDETTRITYVGTGGPIMGRSFALLCRVLAHLRARRADAVDGVRIELYGTASVVGRDVDGHLARVARKHGLTDIVSEAPARVTYRRSLELLLQSHGTLVLGVDDAGYMPSKLFTSLYSGKPLLATLHRASPALSALQGGADASRALWFGDNDEIPLAEAADIVAAFLADARARRVHDRRAALAEHTGAAMARHHADLFVACCETFAP
jgi:hypothetical protein